VHVVKLHKRSFWVQTFDSPVLTESSLIRRGWKLIKDLEDMRRKVDDRFFVFSLYEPPLPFVPHHYEIAVRARCRRHGDVPSGSVDEEGAMLASGQDGDIHGDVHSDVHAWMMQRKEVVDEGVIPVGDDAIISDDDDDDDYPIPEEGGGDDEDDECEDDIPDLSQLLASM
jgi:hypothetical protein